MNANKLDPHIQRQRLARQLSESLSVPMAELRLVETWFHDGTQWTMSSRWEQFQKSEWKEIPWTVLTKVLSRS
ncbi:MAG: hypothetical protein AAF483_12630 [Planctomycetota bacterium]